MTKDNICPECGSQHHQDFIRCPTCKAFLVEGSPWQGEYVNLVAIPIALGLWWGLDALLRQPFMHTADIFGDAISRTILGIALYGVVLLVLKWRIVRRQDYAFRLVRRVCALNTTPGQEMLNQARDALGEANIGAFNRVIAFHRLRWLVSAARVDKEDREGMLEALRQHSESDWDSLESSFAFTQYLIWLLPSAGFLGTVWGMTQALQEFSPMVASHSDLNFTAGLQATALGLGTAFHTTLVGLATVIPILAIATSIRRRSQHLLEQQDKFFLRFAAETLFHAGEADREPVPGLTHGLSPVTPPPAAAEPPVEDVDATAIPDEIAEAMASQGATDPDAEAAAGKREGEADDDTTAEANLELWDKRKREHLSSEGIY